jgi:UDP:flavonoid glycosyltransferase YjiC (YdhE family)
MLHDKRTPGTAVGREEFPRRKRLLFVAEAVTLAHVARPLALCAGLARNWEIILACDARARGLLNGFAGRWMPVTSISSERFLAALARGAPLYDEDVLERYVREDLALLEEVRPASVIGDFRLSLSVSARLAGIPYYAISNGYWSPYWRPPCYPVPTLPVTRFPLPVAQAIFQVARPLAFKAHCRPLNRVRRRHGLAPLGGDLRRIYTDADYVLYADPPELYPEVTLPSHHRFVGPLIWSAPAPLPEWWESLSARQPIVYVTLGSSGRGDLLPRILQSLARLPMTIIASTAGKPLAAAPPPDVYVADYLPGEVAVRRASLVICNGGSPSTQQALRAAVPVIGIADNLDQFLNMLVLSRAGVGECLRADRLQGDALARLAADMLDSPGHSGAAERLAASLARHDPARSLEHMLSA